MKDDIRKRIRAERRNLDAGFINKAGSKILENLMVFGIDDIKRVMAYIPIENEINVTLILDMFLKTGREVYVPCLDEADKLHPCRLKDMNSLIESKYNVPEPAGALPGNEDTFDIILVPGVAFDLKGNRLGYGKGCYDGFLKKSSGIRIGVCYDFQLIKEGIPNEPHDERVDFILTEKGIYEVNHAI